MIKIVEETQKKILKEYADKLVEELKKASYEIMLEGTIIGSEVSIIDLDEAIRIVRRTKVGE